MGPRSVEMILMNPALNTSHARRHRGGGCRVGHGPRSCVRISHRAFTLIELLVVVGIIAILAALLIPGLTAAKRSGQKARCASNLRQLAIAVTAYGADGGGRLPHYRLSDKATPASLYHNNRVNLWGGHENALVNSGFPESGRRKLTEYLGVQVAACPLDRGYRRGSSLDGGIYTSGTFYEVYGTSYVYNTGILSQRGSGTTSLGEPWQTSPVVEVLYSARIEEIQRPSHLVMAGDRTLYYADFFELPGIDYLAMTQMHHETDFEANLVFVDTHVDAAIMRESPDNLRNADYEVLGGASSR